ncbi:mechanosensitive ion channel [Alloacidobacterium dinghuense]|uniref:Mechanosensitive ion channel n=1 Tax=Alloacidobacterium dinghuense TaxID=2763107 RepID=A0A7G8BNY0_9BACT|nr:mechanosensitive ion channel domain-containing protein [Alloacidobacterium dinghuense]QNI34250.1 mechanosensitive ion channel [Alloacidobacterium dinghuense]
MTSEALTERSCAFGGRSTWVCTNDNEIIIVPNTNFITNSVTNWTANDAKVRFAIKVGVSYSSDPQEVKALLPDLAAQHPDVLRDPPPEVIFSDLGDSSLIFLLRIWTAKELGNPQALKSDLYFSIFDAFREHGIEMPFSQLDLHLRTVDASIINTLPNKSILRNGQHNSSIKPVTAKR